MTILGMTLLAYLLGAAFPTQNPVVQAAPDIARDSGPRIVIFDNSVLSRLNVAQSDIDLLQLKFKKDNNVDILLDSSELIKNGLVLWWIPEVEVTARFVEVCKEYQKTGAMLPIKTSIPKASIAVMDMQAMLNGKTGIKQLVKRFKEATQKFHGYTSASEKEAVDKYMKEVRDSIFKELDAFAKERGFNFVFSSSAEQNLNIYSLPSTDITHLFIDKYNRLHP